MNDDRVFSKCAWRLIPFMGLLYLFNYIDRVNVGFAALTMNRDLGFTPTVFGFGAGIFFFSYFLFQLPTNVILHRVGARRTVFFILASWGAVSASCAFIQGPVSFYILRFLLGAAEAGFFPGMLLYLTYWFPVNWRVRCTAAFMAAAPLAFAIGGPASGLLLGLAGTAGLRGWQWLFLLEGIPSILLAFAVLKLLPNGPAQASFLTASEKHAISARLQSEDAKTDQDLGRALRDPRVVALSFALLGNTMSFFGIQFWLPQIVQAAGFSNAAIGFVVAVPFLVSVPAMLFWGRSSDLRNERAWHVALPALLTAASLIVASLASDDMLVLVALSVAAVGTILILPPLNSVPGTFLSGVALAGGLAVYNSLGNLGGFIGPFVIGAIKEQTGGYGPAMVLLALGELMLAAIILSFARIRGPRTVTAEEPELAE